MQLTTNLIIMIFIHLNLNLKQSRISIRIPDQLCSDNLEQELQDNQQISNRIFNLLNQLNSNRFEFKPTTLRQFNHSKINNYYSLSFLIDCTFKHIQLNDQQCKMNMPSDKEMALDSAYCCGNNQAIHLQNLNLTKLNENESSSINLDQLYILFAKQKLFTKFLIESTNRTDYLIVKLLSSRCLIAFDEFFENKDSNLAIEQDKSLNKLLDKLIVSRSTAGKLELREAIFVAFKHLNLDEETDEVKTYRYSFDYEFMQLDNELFNKLLQSFNLVNKSILPDTSRFDKATNFKYSYLLDCNQ